MLVCFGVFGIVFFIYLIKLIPPAVKQTEKAIQEGLPSTYNLSTEDSEIISKQFWPQLKAVEVRNTTTRSPITLMKFDNTYFLFKFKIDLKTNSSLKDILHFDKANVDVSWRQSYWTISNTQYYDFKFISRKQIPVSEIFCTYSASNITNLLNSDTLEIYKTVAQNFSMRYSKDGPKDYVVIDEGGILGLRHDIPMGIIFLKRSKSVYFLFITPTKLNGKIDNSYLLNLIK